MRILAAVTAALQLMPPTAFVAQASEANAITGKGRLLTVAWEHAVPTGIEVRQAVLGSEILIIGEEGQLSGHARNTGQTAWRDGTNRDLGFRPIETGGRWILGDTVGRLEALESGTGRTLWQWQSPHPLDSLEGGRSQLIAVAQGTNLYCVEPATGDIRWQRTIASILDTPPALTAEACVVSSRSGWLAGYALADGRELWSVRLSSEQVSQLAVDGEDVFALGRHYDAWCINGRNGTVRWHRDSGSGLRLPGLKLAIGAVTSRHVIIRSDQGEIHALSRESGEFRSTGTVGNRPAVEPAVLSATVAFVAHPPGRQIAVFDNQAEVFFRRELYPTNWTPLAAAESDILLLSGHNQLVLAKIHTAPANPYLERLAGSTKLWPVMLTGIMVLFGGAFAFALLGQRRVPETHLSNLLLFALLVGTWALCLTTARMGWLLLAHGWDHWAVLAVVVVLFSPCACLCYCQLSTWWWTRKIRPGFPEGLAASQTLRIFTQLVQEMGLQTSGAVVVGPHTPCVLGVSRRSFAVVLPHDLDARALRACGGDRQLASSLIRLVLTHELAHVRNGDILFLPLLTAAQGSLRWSLLAMLGCFALIRLFANDSSVVMVATRLASLVMFGGLALSVLLALARRERERLADATASLFVDPEAIGQLTTASRDGSAPQPPLEKFLAGLKVRVALQKRVFGFGADDGEANRTSHWWRNAFGERNPVAQLKRGWKSRMRSLALKKDAIAGSPAGPLFAAGAAGILAGLIYGAFAHWVAMDFYDHLLRHRGSPADPVAAGFLRSYAGWTHLQKDSLGWQTARTLVPLIAGMLLAGTVLLPWRDVVRRVRLPRQLPSRASMACLVLACGTAGIVFDWVSTGRDPFPQFPGLRVLSIWLWFWSIAAAFFFAVFLFLRTRAWRRGTIKVEACFVLSLAGSGAVGCWWLLAELSDYGRVMWTMALILACSVAMATGRFRRFLAQKDDRDESIRIIRVLGWKRLFCNRWGGELRLTRQYVPWLAAFSLVIFSTPGLLLSLPLKHSLLNMDSTRYEVARLNSLKLARLVEEGPDRIQANRAAYAREFFPALLERRVFDAATPRPSTWLGMIALAVACLLSLGAIGVRALLFPESVKRVLLRCGALADLFRLIELPAVRRRFRPLLESALNQHLLEMKTEVVEWRLLQTCRTVECAAQLGCAENARVKLLEGVLACELNDGGFGPDSQPSLQHTFAALRVAKQLGVDPRCDFRVHEHWLRRELLEIWKRRFVVPPADWLEAAGLAMQGLSQIGGAVERLARQKRFGKEVIKAAFRYWHASLQLALDAKWYAAILLTWHHVSETQRLELEGGWLPAWEAQLALLHPETELKEIADSVTVLATLDPSGYRLRASVLQIQDNLEKHWKFARLR